MKVEEQLIIDDSLPILPNTWQKLPDCESWFFVQFLTPAQSKQCLLYGRARWFTLFSRIQIPERGASLTSKLPARNRNCAWLALTEAVRTVNNRNIPEALTLLTEVISLLVTTGSVNMENITRVLGLFK